MNKLEFLQHWFANRGYKRKAAIQSLIGIQMEDAESSELFAKILHGVYLEKGQFNTVLDGQVVQLDGDITQPFCHMDDRFDFPADFHPVLQGKAVASTFGLMLFNIVLFYEAFTNTVPYVNKAFTDKLIKGILGELMVDDPAEGEAVPEGKASVKQCLKFQSHLVFLEGLGSHFIKPGGVDALSPAPEVLKLKEKLFKEHKDQLGDPVVFTQLVDQLVALDREIQLKGPSRNFYIQDKFISNARKRMFVAFGIEPDADGTGWVALPRTLDEGLDPKEVVAYVNTAVSGAYGRAMATGDGGAKVKETIRLVGRMGLATEDDTPNGTPIYDCGTPKGELKVISEKEVGYWMGSFIMTVDGPVELTSGNARQFVSKPVKVRVPQYCIQPNGLFCFCCTGAKLGANGSRIPAEIVAIPTAQMEAKMKEHHTAGAQTVTLNLQQCIR